MENQPAIPQSSTLQEDQPSIAQHPVQTQQKANLLPITITAIVCAALFGMGGYYLGTQQGKASSNASPSTTEMSANTVVTPSPVVAANKVTLSDALSKNCIDYKIALDALPFAINETLKSAYAIQNSINCFVPEGSYASIAIVVQTPDFSGDSRSMLFFHQGSKWQGRGDDFQSLDNYRQITIDGKNYYLEIIDPDPYGISTLGLWVRVIGEKKDVSTGTIVRVFDFLILKDQEILDLVKKYGVKQTEQNMPEYVIMDPVKRAQLSQEVVRLAVQHPAFKSSAQKIASDLSGIIF